MDSVCLGLIGAGRWGKNIIQTIGSLNGANLKYLVASNSYNRKLVNQDCFVTNSLEKILNNKDLDGLIIATPPSTHAPIAIKAIENGIPLIIEKPLTLISEEAEYIYKLAVESKVTVLVDHIHLYNPPFRKLKIILKLQFFKLEK